MGSGMRIGTGLAAFVLAGAIAGDPAMASTIQPPASDQAAYQEFVKEFRTVARGHGIPGSLYDRAFQGLTPDPEVIERNNRQPEFVLPPSHYMALVVTDTRVREGRRKLAEHAADLDGIERQYGVDRHVLVAIWAWKRRTERCAASATSSGRSRLSATRAPRQVRA